MARLTEQQKAVIVTALACWYGPSEVRDLLKSEYGLDLPLSQITPYDPTTINGQRLSAELKALFHETREKFKSDIQAIPIANQAFRLRELQKLYRNTGKNIVLGASLLEQAAKEAGGMFTNRRELTGKDGGKVEIGISFDDWSVEELDAYASGGMRAVNLLRNAAGRVGGESAGEVAGGPEAR